MYNEDDKEVDEADKLKEVVEKEVGGLELLNSVLPSTAKVSVFVNARIRCTSISGQLLHLAVRRRVKILRLDAVKVDLQPLRLGHRLQQTRPEDEELLLEDKLYIAVCDLVEAFL